jgi:AbrB family transcriptional regulator, stage V sporulation protein T
MTYHAKIIAGGKIVIPAELRRLLGVNTGDSLVIEEEDGKIVLKSYEQVVREIQARYQTEGSDSVDQLLADRREDFALEERKRKRLGS